MFSSSTVAQERTGTQIRWSKHFVKGLNINRKNNIEEFYANDLNVRACQGCLTCAKLGNNTCAIEDDMQRIYSAFVAADIVVWVLCLIRVHRLKKPNSVRVSTT